MVPHVSEKYISRTTKPTFSKCVVKNSLDICKLSIVTRLSRNEWRRLWADISSSLIELMDSRNCVGVICQIRATCRVNRLKKLDITDVLDPPAPKDRLAQTESIHPQCNPFQPAKSPWDDVPRCGLSERCHKQSQEVVVQNNKTTWVSRVEAHYKNLSEMTDCGYERGRRTRRGFCMV